MVLKIKPDVIAVGYDQQPSLIIIKKNLKALSLTPILKRLPALKPKQYKSSIARLLLRDK